jgi:hypothetical protein
MKPRRKKHRCAEPGCPTMLAAVASEYCEKHACSAFSVSYGRCVAHLGHDAKHLSGAGEEW